MSHTFSLLYPVADTLGPHTRLIERFDTLIEAAEGDDSRNVPHSTGADGLQSVVLRNTPSPSLPTMISALPSPFRSATAL